VTFTSATTRYLTSAIAVRLPPSAQIDAIWSEEDSHVTGGIVSLGWDAVDRAAREVGSANIEERSRSSPSPRW